MAPYLFLSLADATAPHASLPERYARKLNTLGRWAVHGTAQSPLLVWPATEAAAAQAAAARASEARGKTIAVIASGDADGADGADGAEAGEVQPFTDALEPALHRPAAQSEARARRLRTEAEKLEAFCRVVRAASTAADQAAFAEVGRAASKALRAKFGGGSITSAFAWLAGRSGQDALDSVLNGEVELGGALSLQQLAEAVALARDAERLQEGR